MTKVQAMKADAQQHAIVGVEAVALGGPGSGWHAEDGHVPGSQGGSPSGKKPQGGPKAKATGPVTKEHVAQIHELYKAGHTYNQIAAKTDLTWSQVHGQIKQLNAKAKQAPEEAVPSAAWTPTGGQQGSNPGGTYTGPDGKAYYVKFYKDPAQSETEVAAQRVHAAVNVPVPEGKVVTIGGKPAVANAWVKATPMSGAQVEAALHADPALAGRMFAASVATQNWDVAGTGHDNIVQTDKGPMVVDVGGAFKYRAQGGLRPYTTAAGEVSTLLDKHVNPWSSKAFGKAMQNPEARASAVSAFHTLKGMDPKAPGVTVHEWRAKIDDALSRLGAPSQSLREVAVVGVEAIALGGPGSGWHAEDGHVPGSQGGSPSGKKPQGGPKAKATGPVTKEHVATIHELYKAGHTYNQIAAKTDLTWSQVHGQIKQLNAKAKQAEQEIAAQLKTVKAAAVPEAVAPPAVPPKVGAQADLALNYGYKWQAKTYGPNAGKYAWFKDGAQQSAFGEQHEADAKAASMHYGNGPKAPPPTAEGSVPRLGKGFTSDTPWPVTDDLERQLGSKFPGQLEDAVKKDWTPVLTPDERSAVANYTSIGYHAINEALRGNVPLKSSVAEKVRNLKTALAKAPAAPPPELVWRSMGAKIEEMFQRLEPGDVIGMKGFQSTSIDPSFASEWSEARLHGILEIKPSRGAYVKPVSHHPSEHEYLLDHDAKYAVRGITHVKVKGSTKPVKVLQLEML